MRADTVLDSTLVHSNLLFEVSKDCELSHNLKHFKNIWY